MLTLLEIPPCRCQREKAQEWINYNNNGWRENVRQGVRVGIVRRMVLAGVRR